MLHTRQVREVSKPIIEVMYGGKVRYNDAYGIHQWSPDEVSWETLSKLYSITDYYVGTVNEKVVYGLFIMDEGALYWPGTEKGTLLYLHKIHVDPVYSGNSYVDTMIQCFTEERCREGYPNMRLDVREHEDKPRRMYERSGFQLYRTGRFHPDFTTVLYICPFKKTVQLSIPVSQQLMRLLNLNLKRRL